MRTDFTTLQLATLNHNMHLACAIAVVYFSPPSLCTDLFYFASLHRGSSVKSKNNPHQMYTI